MNKLTLAFLCFVVCLTTSFAQTKNKGRTQGYIIKKEGGKTIKIPKKQEFEFGGSDVEGGVERPSQSVISSRKGADRKSLLPLRKNFRQEIMNSMIQTSERN